MPGAVEPITPLYTAELFPPLHRELIDLLRGLEPEDWERPTVAPRWQVRDVVAHLLDIDLRKDSAWRLLYNAMSAREARDRARIEGDASLAEPLFAVRSVMV